MVSTKNALFRYAFTMIELIFAIVIIGIAVMSLPIMTQITSKGIENSIVQEAIFAASAELMSSTSYYWDQTSMVDSNLSHMSRVIDIGSTCENNASSPRYRLRSGHVTQPLHRRCLDGTTTTLGATGGTYLGLNDAAHTASIIFTDATKNAAGYKDSYDSNITVTLTHDEISLTLPDDNVKKIEVIVSDSDGDIVVLKTYSANIGEVDYFKKRFL